MMMMMRLNFSAVVGELTPGRPAFTVLTTCTYTQSCTTCRPALIYWRHRTTLLFVCCWCLEYTPICHNMWRINKLTPSSSLNVNIFYEIQLLFSKIWDSDRLLVAEIISKDHSRSRELTLFNATTAGLIGISRSFTSHYIIIFLTRSK